MGLVPEFKIAELEKTVEKLNELIKKNNSFSENFNTEIDSKRDQFKNHLVASFLKREKYLSKEKKYNNAIKEIEKLNLKVEKLEEAIFWNESRKVSDSEGALQYTSFIQSFLSSLFSLLFGFFIFKGLIRLRPNVNLKIWTIIEFINILPSLLPALFILLKYAVLLFFPLILCYDYSYAQIPVQSITNIWVLLSLLFYLFITIFAFYNLRRKDWIASGILFCLITLGPISNMFYLIGTTMAERLLFTPSLGFCLVATFFLLKLKQETGSEVLLTKANYISNQLFSINRKLFVMVLLILTLYSIKTFTRNKFWKDNVTLFGHDVKIANRSARAHYNWGICLLYDVRDSESSPDRKNAVLEEAIAELNKATLIYPEYNLAFRNLAIAYNFKNDVINEIKSYESLLQIETLPDTAVFYSLGLLYSKNNQYDQALSILDSCEKYHQSIDVVAKLKGFCYLRKGFIPEAIKEFTRGLEVNPNDPELYTNMAAAYLHKNENLKANDLCEKALKIDSVNAKAYCYIGCAYSNEGKYTQALTFFKKSLTIDSTDHECKMFIEMTNKLIIPQINNVTIIDKIKNN